MKRAGQLDRRTPLRRTAIKAARKVVARRRVADPIPDVSKIRVKLRADFRCEMCGDDLFHRTDGEMSHRLPRGMGGGSHPDRHSPANLLYSCPDCHRDIESHRSAAYDLGRLVRRGYDPRYTPVLIHRHGWVLLGHDGTIEEAPAVRP